MSVSYTHLRTLGSAQAGVYAGDQLLLNYDLAGGISQLEADLNRIYMAYSLPRADLFEHVKVSATGDVDTLEFYGISAFVLYLLLAAIPVSGYLAPESRVMSQKLSLAGIGPWMATEMCIRDSLRMHKAFHQSHTIR